MKFRFIILFLGILVIIFGFLFGLEFKNYIFLKKRLLYTQQRLKEVTRAQQEWESLRKKLHEYRFRQKIIERKIPENEEIPLRLMKQIVSLTSKFKIRNIEFVYKKNKEPPELNSKNNLRSEYGEIDYGESEFNGNFKASQGSQYIEMFEEKSIPTKSLMIEISFECNFFELLSFLKELLKLERIVSIEGIKIMRSSEIIPFQKITLNLVTYTFSNSGDLE